ncbi:MAG: hypothetical protein IT424_01025 [Pirellulales bacterium]|nr:hypothetical protein [Pirellulales bacterium]
MRACRTFRYVAAALLGLTAIGGVPAIAQQTLVSFNVSGPADWNDPANWNPANVPEAQFNEVALIGALRQAFVDDTPPAVGGIIMDSSTLEIRPGGNLGVVPGPDAGAVPGNIVMGQSVNTSLIVRRGGTLSAQNLTTGGGAGTQLTLGETGGAGVAALSINGGTLNRITRIVGPNVNFTVSGNLTLGTSHTLVPVITGATHSAINVTGTADLAGVVRPELSSFTPSLGASWNLVTAAQVTGTLSVDASQIADPPRGARYYVTQTATSARLNYGNVLILKVDRNTGATILENALGGPINFDAYTIASPSGSLSGPWNSLQDQGLPNWDEADNASATRRTEFKTSGTTALNAGSTRSLGALFAPAVPTAFGQEFGNDLSFNYSVPGSGTVSGIVEMSGARNNLVLTINPANGQAAIQNESPYFDVSLHAYTITSASGKLRTANGTWNSLQDQTLPAWDQADNSDANRITEFKTSGGTPLAGGGTVLNLGAPVNTTAGALDVDDFGFQFALSTGEIMNGIVRFGPLPTFTPTAGDYDANGKVDGGDFLVWQRSFGAAVTPGAGADGSNNGILDAADLGVWKTHFGASAAAASGPASAAVPEPASLAAAVLALAGLASVRRQRPAQGGKAG